MKQKESGRFDAPVKLVPLVEQKKFVPAPNIDAQMKQHRDYLGLM